MPSTQRASLLLVALSAWAIMSAVASLLIINVLQTAASPMSFSTLTSDINNIQDMAALKKIALLMVGAVAAQKEAGTLLVSWGLWFVATWSAIFGLASAYLYRQLAAANVADIPRSNETILDLALAGKLELWKAFWGMYIALPLAVMIVAFGLMAFLKRAHIVEPAKVADLIVTPMAYSAVLVVFWGASIIAWRCSVNTSRTAWSLLARIAIVLFTVAPAAKSAVLLIYYLGRAG